MTCCFVDQRFEMQGIYDKLNAVVNALAKLQEKRSLLFCLQTIDVNSDVVFNGAQQQGMGVKVTVTYGIYFSIKCQKIRGSANLFAKQEE